MQSPLQIEYDGLSPSDAISARIRRRVDHLEKIYSRIVDGRVVVELSNRRHRKGNIFCIRIELNVPGDRLVVSNDATENHAHSDVYVAMRDAFDAMERILQEYVRKIRGEVKHHKSALTNGKIERIFRYEGYGFIVTEDNREIYFDANAVLDKTFENLEVGRKVRFSEERGDKGPQASTVHA